MQNASLTAEDFHFTPDLVRILASAPLTLSQYNTDLKMHEFESPILMYAAYLVHMAVLDENERPVEVHLTRN